MQSPQNQEAAAAGCRCSLWRDLTRFFSPVWRSHRANLTEQNPAKFFNTESSDLAYLARFNPCAEGEITGCLLGFVWSLLPGSRLGDGLQNWRYSHFPVQPGQ